MNSNLQTAAETAMELLSASYEALDAEACAGWPNTGFDPLPAILSRVCREFNVDLGELQDAMDELEHECYGGDWADELMGESNGFPRMDPMGGVHAPGSNTLPE